MGEVQSRKKPIFQMLGGGPASGKSSIINPKFDGPVNLKKRLGDHVKIDPDDIKKEFAEYQAGLKAGEEKIASFVHEESSYLAKQITRRCGNLKVNAMLDGTGDSTLEKLTKKANDMRSQGFKVVADYVTCDIDEALKRNWKRFLSEGRLPPPEYLVQCHKKISEVLPQALKNGVFDELNLWDTTFEGQKIKIAKFVNGELKILNKPRWDAFIGKTKYEASDEIKDKYFGLKKVDEP